jgi:hypothetical protein
LAAIADVAEKTCEVCKGQSRKPSKVILRNLLKRAVLSVAHWPISTSAAEVREARHGLLYAFARAACLGFPDLVFFGPHGQACFFELKAKAPAWVKDRKAPD